MTLTTGEAGMVLTAAQLLDNRTFTKETARAWALLFDEAVTLPLAYAAVRAHYSTSTKFLMPAHINAYVAEEAGLTGAKRQVELDRLDRAKEVNYPSGLTIAQEREYRVAWQGYVKAGASREQATVNADAELGYSRGPEIAMPREVKQLMAGFVNAHTAR